MVVGWGKERKKELGEKVGGGERKGGEKETEKEEV